MLSLSKLAEENLLGSDFVHLFGHSLAGERIGLGLIERAEGRTAPFGSLAERRVTEAVLCADYFHVHSPGQVRAHLHLTGRGFDPDLISICDAQPFGRLGMNDQRIVWLEVQQPRIVLRARARVTSLFPVDQIKRIVLIRLPVARFILRQRDRPLPAL